MCNTCAFVLSSLSVVCDLITHRTTEEWRAMEILYFNIAEQIPCGTLLASNQFFSTCWGSCYVLHTLTRARTRHATSNRSRTSSPSFVLLSSSLSSMSFVHSTPRDWNGVPCESQHNRTQRSPNGEAQTATMSELITCSRDGVSTCVEFAMHVENMHIGWLSLHRTLRRREIVVVYTTTVVVFCIPFARFWTRTTRMKCRRNTILVLLQKSDMESYFVLFNSCLVLVS